MSSVRRRAWGSIIPALTLVAGTLFAASASTARGTDLRDGGRTRITDLIAVEQRRAQQARQEYQRLRHEVDALSSMAGRRDRRVEEARAVAAGRAAAAGFTELRGRAVRVTLDDAPRDRRHVGDPSADDLVVHQQDLQAVVNALWAGGARGMQIMDQRVIATSAVRCVGNTLILQGVVYSPPFRVTAVGEPRRLRAALDASPAIETYQDYVRRYGLGYQVETLDEATLPAYDGTTRMEHATVPEEQDGAS